MHHLYFYGASDDCHEVESNVPAWRQESYGDILLTIPVVYEDAAVNWLLTAHWEYDGDWGVELQGDLPADFVLTAIEGNCAMAMRGGQKPQAGQFLHLQVPEGTVIHFTDLDAEDD